MKKILFQILTLFILVSLISSCIMNKRRYMRGYDVSFTNHKMRGNSVQLEKAHPDNLKIEISKGFQNSNLKEDYDQIIFASIDSKIGNNHKTNRENLSLIDNDCDNIIMKNGNEVKCKVLEIGTTEIKYKKCDNLSGPTYSISKQDVLMIQYANGTKEIMPQQEVSNNASSNQKNRADFSNAKNHPLAVWSLVSSLVGWFFFGIGVLLGIIFGAIALSKIKSNPEKYKGRGMALAGLIIGVVIVAVVILLLLIL